MATFFVGIDPGASGGLVKLSESSLMECHPMPGTPKDLYDLIHDRLCCSPTLTVVCLEKVTGYVGGEGESNSSSFKFGKSYGALEMALVACAVTYHEVAPAVWQKAVGVAPRQKGEDKTAWKNRLKKRAQQLYPDAKITLKTADALLIAHYCALMYGGWTRERWGG